MTPLVMFDLDAVAARRAPTEIRAKSWAYRRVELPTALGEESSVAVRWASEKVFDYLARLFGAYMDVAWVGEGASPGYRTARGLLGLGGIRRITSPDITEEWWDTPHPIDRLQVEETVHDAIQDDQPFVWASSLIDEDTIDSFAGAFGSQGLLVPVDAAVGLTRSDLIEISRFLDVRYVRSLDCVMPKVRAR